MLKQCVGALLVCVGLIGCTVTAFAQERIHTFDVRIEAETSGDIIVTERILVRAEGDNIKRGIYRDLPFSHGFGSRLEILSVKRDGRAESYHTEDGGEGTLLYIGQADVFLQRGDYEYEITYRVDDEVRHFADYDEVYWNVTGDGWAFPIEKANARVILPEGAKILSADAYTGAYGEDNGRHDFVIDSDREARFYATSRLSPGEGMTIAVAFPKGLVEGPSDAELFLQRIGGIGSLIGIAGLLLIFGYYWIVWNRVGKDPRARTHTPIYHSDLPPAAVRFIDRMGFDQKTFATALISLAVKGHIKIEDNDGYTLTRLEPDEDRPPKTLSPGEQKVLDRLLSQAGDSLSITKTNRSAIKSAEAKLKGRLEGTYNSEFFKRNSGYVIAGAVMSLVLWVVMVLAHGFLPEALFLSVWLGIWTIGCALLLTRVYMSWRDVSRSITTIVPAVVITAFSVPFIGGWFFGAGFLVTILPWQTIAIGVSAATLNAGFFDWMKVRTPIGREIQDEIDGLRLYLGVAEKDRMNFHNPPDRTPEHFEEMLPYALALGVENKWAEQFASVFEKLAQEGRGYQPVWYGGSRWRMANLASLGGNLSSSLASATAVKSSSGGSSGSFGGGFSGGGGGGGGGGGW